MGRIGKFRIAGVVGCILLGGAAGAAIFFDREEERFGPRARLLPSFSAGYQCSDARDQLSAKTLVYRLRYDEDRWLAEVSVSVVTDDLRGPCELRLGVPPRSEDVSPDADGARVVSLRRDGSPSSGTAVARVAPGGGGEYVLHVSLPKDFDMFHSVGLGRYFFRFSFFAPGEGASFKTGRVDVEIPDGYTFVEAVPSAGSTAPSVTSRSWTLKTDRDVETRVTFENDALRGAVDLAPEGLLVALAGLLAFLVAPARKEVPVEAPAPGPAGAREPAVAPAPELEPAPAPVPVPVPVRPEPERAPSPVQPEPELEPVQAPAQPEPERAPAPALTPPPRPQLPPAIPAEPLVPVPRDRARAAAARAGRLGLAVVAAAFVVRLLRRRSRH